MALLPSAFKIARAELINNSNETTSESRSLIVRSRKTNGQRFEFYIESVSYEPQDIKPLMGFFAGVKQSLDVVTFTLPVFSESTCPNKTVNGARVAGTTTVAVTSGAGVQVGDYFNFSNHSKAYIVTGISGNTITFAPNLTTNVPNGAAIIFNGCTFTCRLRRGPFSFMADSNQSATINLDVYEAL